MRTFSRHPYRHRRRGAALLLVLAVLIVTLTAAAAFARAASTARLAHAMDLSTEVADDLLAASETPIVAWLQDGADRVVLPPDATEPRVDVLHDEWTLDETPVEIRITAWDQCGMIPIDRLRGGSTLRLAVPSDVQRLFDRTDIPRRQIPGLDLFAPGRDDPPVYPVSPVAAAMPFAGLDSEPTEEAPPTMETPSPADEPEPALGACIATHNPSRINVHTAPEGVLHAVYRATGRGGLEAVLEARSAGEQVAIADAPRSRARANRLAIAGTSTAWAFRIDIRVGSARRAWWAVYVRSDSAWECAQRLAIVN